MSAELADAVAVIVQAWAPPAVVGDQDDNSYDEETNGCGCGGEDDDGDPICNCADSCGCPSCEHYRHQDSARCHLRVPREGQPYAWCGAPTRYRIRPFCVHRHGVSRVPSEGDPAATENGYVRLGDSVQWHPITYACSTQHARQLIDADREHRAQYWAEDSPLHADRTFYEVDSFRYEPDRIDVPPPLGSLPHLLSSAQYWAEDAVRKRFAGIDVTWALRGLRQYLVWSLELLLEYDAKRAAPDEYGEDDTDG